MLIFGKKISKISLGAIGGAFSAVLGAFCGWILFPALVALNVNKQTVLEEGTEQFERWVNLPQPMHFKVYIFNVTNPNEAMKGAKPTVKEVGPYIYRQYRRKIVDEITPDRKLISFRTIQTFVFDEEASLPLREQDELVVINAQLNSVLQMADTIISPQLGIFNGQLSDVFGKKYSSIFMRVRPNQLLFNGIPLCVDTSGIAKMICSIIKRLRPKTMKLMEDDSFRFAFFEHKNNSDDGLFEMYTGVDNIDKLGIIRKWNKQNTIQTWLNTSSGHTSICNMINGTDTTVYPPHIQSTGYKDIFSTDICRSVRIYYKEKLNFNGISVYRFETSNDFLRDVGPEYGNECFCIDKIANVPMRSNGCLYKGALDLTNCQGGPIVITLPHMLGTAPEYQTVNGLTPDPEKHLIYADIEPVSGYPVRGAKRLQLNIFLKKINQIDITENVKTCLFPILWIDEGVELNESMQSLLKRKLIIFLIILDVVHYSMIVGGTLVCIICSVLYLIRRNKENIVIPLR